MPFISINNCNYYYDSFGEGEETIVLSHGLLWSSKMFYKQVAFLKQNYRVIVYDHRGQGRSEVTKKGYDMDSLYEDAVQLIEQLELGKVHFGGLSMGGFVAMRIAARRPDLIKSLILMETSALDEPNKTKYWFLNTIVKLFGVKAVQKPVMKIMFGKKFLTDKRRTAEKNLWIEKLNNNKRSIVRAVSGVINRNAIDNELGEIRCPTLILVGTQDKATVPAMSEFIHNKIRNSKLTYIEGGGHTACIEEGEQYNGAIIGFLKNMNHSS